MEMGDYEMKRVGLRQVEYTDTANGRKLSFYVEPSSSGSSYYLSKGSNWSNGDPITWNNIDEIRKNVDDYFAKKNLAGCLVLRP